MVQEWFSTFRVAISCERVSSRTIGIGKIAVQLSFEMRILEYLSESRGRMIDIAGLLDVEIDLANAAYWQSHFRRLRSHHIYEYDNLNRLSSQFGRLQTYQRSETGSQFISAPSLQVIQKKPCLTRYIKRWRAGEGGMHSLGNVVSRRDGRDPLVSQQLVVFLPRCGAGT